MGNHNQIRGNGRGNGYRGNVNWQNSNQGQEEEVDMLVDDGYVIKPLDSAFSSFGEAVFSYVNSIGYGRDKRLDGGIVRPFCEVLNIPVKNWDSSNFDFSRYYFKSSDWLHKYLDNNNWVRTHVGTYFKLDAYNRPIAVVDINVGTFINISITGCMSIVNDFAEVCRSNVYFDNTVPYSTEYMEIKLRRFAGNAELQTTHEVMKHSRVALPEYYPYLDGSIEALIQDFIESDDTVLILMGPPGCGKSSAVMAAAKTLNIKPIYANNSDVITHPDFVDYIFNTFDGLLFNYQDPIRARNMTEMDFSSLIEIGLHPTFTDYTLPEDPMHGISIQDANRRLPIIIIEDADQLMAPRKSGNTAMSNFLNQTDGVSSSTARKVILNTNLKDLADIDEGLLRVGRCYRGEPVNFRLLSHEEAVIARKASGLPDFEVTPTKSMSLAEALVKPRPKIVLEKQKPRMGFGN